MALLSFTLGLLFVVKTSCMDWGSTYLTYERGVSGYLSISYVTSMEVGGIVGSVFVGAMTDFLIRRRYYYGSGQSPRMIIVQLCVAGSCLFLNLFLFALDSETTKVRLSAMLLHLGQEHYVAMLSQYILVMLHSWLS